MSLSVRSTLLIGLTLACMAGLSQVADAGTYQVMACTESVGYVNHSWNLYNNDQTHIENHSGCGEQASPGQSPDVANLAVADVMGASTDAPVGAEAGWRFLSPIGTTITEVTGLDGLFSLDSESWAPSFRETGGQVLGGEACPTEHPYTDCFVGGQFGVYGLSTDSLSLGILCPGNTYGDCPIGATIHDVRAELDEAVVTLSDPTAPAAVAGSGIPTSVQHGVISIDGSAVDTTAGLVALSLINDADEVVGGPVSVPGGCNYSFTTPCPIKAEDLAIPLDTTKLPNGRNQIRIEATNAAHDEGFSSPYTITVENGSPKQEGDTGYPSGGEPGAESKSSGSNLNESNGNPGNSGSSQISSGAPGGQLTPVTKPLLPPLQLKTKATRSIDGDLLISGLVSRGATGALDLVVRGDLTAHRVWTYKATVLVEHGRFRLRVRLPKRLARRTVNISLSYPGSLFFGPAKVSLIIRARHSRLGQDSGRGSATRIT